MIGQFILADDMEEPAWWRVRNIEGQSKMVIQHYPKTIPSRFMVIIERPTFKLSDLLTSQQQFYWMAFGIRNLGTIIRAMVAFGSPLCVTDNCVDVFHPKAWSSSGDWQI